MALKRTLAALLTFVAGSPAVYVAYKDFTDIPVVMWVVMACVPLAAASVLVRRLEPQIFARAANWAILVMGTLLSIVVSSGRTEVHAITGAMVLGSAGALLLLGADGLDDQPTTSAFVPKAFRGVLVAILVMALADTAALLFWGGLVLEDGPSKDGLWLQGFLLGGGGLMALAVLGLYRLRAWAFFLNVVANIGIAAGAWLVPSMPNEIAACLSATAIGQILVGLPLVRGIATGSARAPLSPTVARRAGALVVVAIVSVAMYARSQTFYW